MTSDIAVWIILIVGIVAAIVVAVAAFRTLGVIRQRLEDTLRDEFKAARDEAASGSRSLRDELATGASAVGQQLTTTLSAVAGLQQLQLDGLATRLTDFGDSTRSALEAIRGAVDSRLQALQESNDTRLEAIRSTVDEKLRATLDGTRTEMSATLLEFGSGQRSQLQWMTERIKELADSNQTALDRVGVATSARIKELQEGNEKKLDEMRSTVDEKLHGTLERRLAESFKLVDDRLEAVQRGLGEMQSLASGVGDLKRVLTNVKARGTWAEVQLGALLDQILAPGQYAKNVRTREDAGESVEYAVRLPGPKTDPDACVWLPIDSKFPQEDYLRLQEAADKGDPDGVQRAVEALARAVRAAANQVGSKYLNPPRTTDFALMYLATEGLYSEVLRQPALVEDLQHRYRVVVAGPTTLVAILSSLRMGFQTLAIEQRAAEVWRVLAAVKTEFGKFSQVLDKVKKQLNTASQTIEDTGVRARAMERKLRSVEELPEEEALVVLRLPLADESPAAGGE